jgi:anti-sigma regulatory factor (Ser/Thr protein kinase)
MRFSEVQLAGGPEAPTEARRALRERLRDQVPANVIEDAGLLVSELVTNSVLHGRADAATRVALRLGVNGRRVRIEVRDAGPGFTSRRESAGPDEPGGYGLFLVTQLADAWGIADDGEPTTVWFELRHAAREA